MTLALVKSGLVIDRPTEGAPPTITPILDLAFKESSGTTAADEQSLQAGTYIGSPDLGIPAMVSAGGGFGYKDKDLQYLSIAHNAAFEFATAFTLGVLFQPSAFNTIGTLRQGIVSKVSSAGHEISIETRLDNGTPRLRAYKAPTPGPGGAVFIGPSTGFSTLQIGRNDWIFFVSTPTGTRVVHLGQEFSQSVPLLDGSMTSNLGAFGLGCYLHPTNGPQIPGNGCIGRFVLFDFALTNSQISDYIGDHAPNNTIWLRPGLSFNIEEGSDRAIDLAPHSHPETITAIAGDDGDVATHDTPSGSSIVLDTSDISVDTADTVTAQVTTGSLTSAETEIDLIVQATAGGSPRPNLPSLTTWLTSDETTPTATKFVSNQNRGNGSGSSAANAQAVQSALSAASAGQTFVAVCQTPGTIEFWDFPTGLTFPSGSAGNLITLQARQGDGIVISAGEDFAGARTPNNGFWTQSGLSSDDISKHIWRSTSTISGGEQMMMGWWVEFGTPHQLVRAANMTNLRATYGTGDSPTNYAGPMVHKSTDGRVYIRFQRPHPDKYSTDDKWSVSTWPGHPEAVSGGKLVYPISQDPNDYVIYLTRIGTASSLVTTCGFDAGNSGHHIKIGSGINSMGFKHAIRFGNAAQMHRGLHISWMDLIQFPDTGTPRSDFYANRMRSTDGCKIHASRAEWKFGGWLESTLRSCFFRCSGTNAVNGFYFKNCTIGHFHDISAGGKGRRVRFRNCAFDSIVDDGVQWNQNFGEFEYGYCYFYNTSYGGGGSGGTEGDPDVPGQWYIHHNISDNRQERGTNWRAQPHSNLICGRHSADGRNPWKAYNNLFLFGPDGEEQRSLCISHCWGQVSNNTLTGAANMHEVFNNIMIRTWITVGLRYDAISSLGGKYSDNLQGRSDFVTGFTTRYSAASTNELFDYNCYWRPSALNTSPLIYKQGRSQKDNVSNYATLSAWKASPEFAHSKLSGSMRSAYSPGFDGNSTEAKPTIPTIDDWPNSRFNYRPSPTSVVTTAASGSLSGANWWSSPPTWGADYFPWNDGAITLAPSPWKGALDPNGSDMPVGPQNP